MRLKCVFSIALMLAYAGIALALPPSSNEPRKMVKVKYRRSAVASLIEEIDAAVVKEFRKAWRAGCGGVAKTEGLVLLYRKVNGSIMARAQEFTNEQNKVSFAWRATIIAIAHTHPNSINAEPAAADQDIADRFGVPVFTLTNRGMFVYDPETKQTSRVQEDLDWLDPAKWPVSSKDE